MENNTKTGNSSGAKKYDSSSGITGKILLLGELELTSPLIIGSGEGDKADLEVLRDFNGKPFIPGTTLAGVIRSLLKQRLSTTSGNELWEKHLLGNEKGASEEKSRMSSVSFSDAHLAESSKAVFTIRDSVRIDPRTNTAEDTGKFDYEVLEKGARFELQILADQREEDAGQIELLMAKIQALFTGESVRLGAKTNSGFGAVKLLNDKLLKLDFQKPRDVKTWLTIRQPRELAQRPGVTPLAHQAILQADDTFTEPKELFHFKGSFAIRNSLLIRSYQTDDLSENNDAEMLHREVDGKREFVVPGTSLRGAIRHQALKLWNTYRNNGQSYKPDVKNDFTELFGFVATDPRLRRKKEFKPNRSRVRISETVVENPLHKLQMRVKIDRFTGGAVDSALFNSVPLWRNGDDAGINLEITAEIRNRWEAGLLLLVIKDLWTGYMAVGGEKNVGRGIFQGRSGTITYRDDKSDEHIVEMKSEGEQFQLDGSEEDKQLLDKLVAEFSNLSKEEAYS